MRPTRLITALTLAFGVLAAATQSRAAQIAPVSDPTAPDLRVEIAGVKNAQGHVRVDICVANEFLKDDCHYSGTASASPGVTTVLVRNVPPGVYAVQAYHDRNDNHEVDRNAFGLPTEAVGFSNNAPVHLHPPSFKAAAFDYSGGEKTISFKLRHFAD